jgi:hypothetical protein
MIFGEGLDKKDTMQARVHARKASKENRAERVDTLLFLGVDAHRKNIPAYDHGCILRQY